MWNAILHHSSLFPLCYEEGGGGGHVGGVGDRCDLGVSDVTSSYLSSSYCPQVERSSWNKS